jgi:hypothetical protein
MIVDTRGRTWQKNFKMRIQERKKVVKKNIYYGATRPLSPLSGRYSTINCFVSFRFRAQKQERRNSLALTTNSLKYVRYISIFLFCFYAITPSSSNTSLIFLILQFSRSWICLRKCQQCPLFSDVLFFCAS